MLTAQEMTMREALSRSKQVKLRDPNIFISPLRLCLRNIPLSIDDRQLRAACQKVAGKEARITEVSGQNLFKILQVNAIPDFYDKWMVA